jgi:LysM repeat protein
VGFGEDASASTIRYIDNTATGANDGTSWTNAWVSFSDALSGCLAPALTDDVVVYYKNGLYQENTDNSGYFKVSGDFVHNVTFRHDQNEDNGVSTTEIVPKGSTTSAVSNMKGILISDTTKNIIFEDLTFSAKKVVLDTMDETTGWEPSQDLDLSVNNDVYQNLPSDPNPNSNAALNFTKTRVDTTDISATKTISANALGSVGYTYLSFYIKDSSVLEKLAITNTLEVRMGSDSNNYRSWIYDTSVLTTGWNYLVKPSTSAGTPLDQSLTYLHVSLQAKTNETIWSPGDIIIDDIRTQFGVPFLIAASSGLGVVAKPTQNITFKRCNFIQYANLAYGAIYSYPDYVDEEIPSISNIVFDDCNFYSHSHVSTVTFYKSTPYTSTDTTRPYGPLTFTDSAILNTYKTGSGLKVHNSLLLTVKNSDIISEASPLYLNWDYTANLTGLMMNAIIEDSNFLEKNYNLENHGVFFGYNTPESSIIMRRCSISFPNNPDGFALVLKATHNTSVESTIVNGGNVILKAPGSNNIIRNATLLGSNLNLSSSGQTTEGYSIINSVFKAAQGGLVFKIDKNIWGISNFFDYNYYDISNANSSYPFGAISSGMVNNLSSFNDLLDAWVDVGNLTNDLNSSSGNSLFDDYPVNLNLSQASPLIDAGSSISVGIDILGNPRYGTPDIGAYEYQPPHTIGSNKIDTGAGARIYGDGKFRDLATTNSSLADLTITPENSFEAYASDEVRPEWLNITNITWEDTKEWTESSPNSSLTNTLHTVGDLEANKYYNVSVDNTLGSNIEGDNCTNGICKANSEGKIAFTYTGTYSEHTFKVEPGDNTAPTVTDDLTPKFSSDTTSVTLSITTDENSTCKYDSENIAYDEMTPFATTGEINHETLIENLTPNLYTYFAICRDTVGNDTAHTLNFEIAKVKDVTNVSDIKIGTQILDEDKRIYFEKDKTKLKGINPEIANGKVKIYKNNKFYEEVTVDENGKWSKNISFGHDHNYKLKIKFYDEFSTLKDEKEYQIKVDTEKPSFINPLPETLVIQKGQEINFKAKDSNNVEYYKIKLLDKNGHILRSWRKQTKSNYIVPGVVADKAHIVIIRAYDKAGNYEEQQTVVDFETASANINTEVSTEILTEVSTNVSTTENANACSYTIKSGDTLWSIANEVYGDGSRYQKIIELNKEKYSNIETKLSIGQELALDCGDKQAKENDTKQEDISVQNDQKVESQTEPQAQTQVQAKKETQEKTSRWWNPFSWF